MVDSNIPDWDSHETGIYFILAADVNRVKIGKTINIVSRLSKLNTDSPVDLELIAYFLAPESAERFIHCIFDKYRVRGEWFIYSEQIKNVVKRLNTLRNATFTDCIADYEHEDLSGTKYKGISGLKVFDSKMDKIRYK